MTEPATTPRIRDESLADALGERYLAYALSTIMSRSLPNVRDGLKPVHRRLLHAMRQLKLDPGSGYKKCARVVGDVIGKYHPHGDAAVYDALVRLAQDFSVRYPLVDGQGNFGNIDGDNAAAMRYTEARLTEVARALLDGIDEDAVDFRPTYDGHESEPVVLPAGFPNLLANGATGIAVGMATSIPPHNAGEVCAAALHLIKYPKATISKLCQLMPGPDFPTGGVIAEAPEDIIESYKRGRGGFRLRARWSVEKQSHGLYQIVVSEIPYQVQKSRLVEKIATLLEAKKLGLLADIRDESTEEVRLVLEPRNRSVDPQALMETLYRQTDLEVRIGLNMNVLDADQTPRVMNLREVLQAFLDHRHEVLKRRTRHRIDRIEARLETLGAYLAAYGNLDKVIRIIREDDEPRVRLGKLLKINETQVEAILNMRLRRLRKLDEVAIGEEFEALTAERGKLGGVLKDKARRMKILAREIEEIRKRFGEKTEIGRRRTEIGPPPDTVVIPPDATVERQDITVACSAKGWIRAFKGHLEDVSEIKNKEGDATKFVFHAQTTDKILIFATNGRFYTLGCDGLPPGRGFGEPVRLMIELSNEHDLVNMFVHRPGRKLLVAASDGRGLVVAEDDVVAQTRIGKQVLNVKGDAEAQACAPVEGDAVAVVGENRRLLIFPLIEVPTRNRGRGVILQKYRQGGLADIKTFTLAEGLSWKSGERTRTETDLTSWIGKRAQAGRLPPKGFARTNRFG
ncbi:MAG: DNA topoisomerase IV subunit A [Proteobacteria bacterium]|nr:DNA topoisomerase IV subunit A [Pseudomonadota bacterium]MCH8095983.1 DNA topoisomerase IV subunit A [Pseudomonadota bacterium]